MKMNCVEDARRLLGTGAATWAVAMLLASSATAGDYYLGAPGSISVKIGKDSEGATPVEEVLGKEYSHTNWMAVAGSGSDPNLVNVEDHDAFGVPDPLQVVSWDGVAGPPEGNSGSVDAFDFGTAGFNYPEGQVDALANKGDALFKQVIRNEASLLFSVTADVGGVGTGHIHYEDPAGGAGVWAAIETGSAGPGPGPGVNHHPVSDVDALEVWGPEPPKHENGDTEIREGYIGGIGGTPTADANRFSLDIDALSGVSVWAYDIPSGFVAPFISHADIVSAVETLFLGPDGRFDDETRRRVDVDGTMVRDIGDDSPTSPLWGAGDELLFTIDPILDGTALSPTGGPIAAPLIDGGEIMHLVNTGGGSFTIGFLSHGGHLWDTAFDVSTTFGYEFEDVDALEAVGTLTGDTDINTPEPSTVVLCGLAVALVGFGRRLK